MRQFLVSVFILGGSLFAQTNQPEKTTARQYYEELKAASGVNRFNTMVCFREKEPEIFDLIAFTKEVEAIAKAKGIEMTPQDHKIFDRLDSIYIQTYNKGVKTGESMLAHDKSDQDFWSDEVQVEGRKFRMVITLSPAGRYRRAVYLGGSTSTTAEGYGKCERIQ